MRYARPITLLLLCALLAGTAAAQSPQAPDWRAEIRQLHEFFAGWYTGELADTDENFARLTDVLADDFQLITGGGFTVDRDMMVGMMRGEHGSRPDMEMHVDEPRLRLHEGGLILFTYREHGSSAGRSKSTLITVLMREVPEAPNGVQWVHLHETELPAAE